MAKSYILGTAGHIDHGKSSLVCALTGTNPDRLLEEKRRGITIELGFAQLQLPSGRAMGVVDVPGHERFVRQMVAGASGVDVALLVIAADDGIMPQTVEHMAVLELLGVKTCVVALTKIDLVDPEWVSFMSDEIADRLVGGPFEGACICPVSSKTGHGLDELKLAIDAAATHAEKTKPEGALRLPVDRVFTIKGFGTVVTGTLWSGTVHVGDELLVLPAGTPARVRSIQMHDHDFDVAHSGNRVALCLSSLTTDDVRPGDFLAASDAVVVSDRFDASLLYADPFKAGKPLKSGVQVRVAHGTREVTGRLLCMNEKPWLKPGERDFVQIRLDAPLPLCSQDHFIVRSLSPVRVIAGGSVLLAHPRRRTSLSEAEQKLLAALEQEKLAEAFEAYVSTMDAPEALVDIAQNLSMSKTRLRKLVDAAVKENRICYVDDRNQMLARPATVQKLISTIERNLLSFHAKNPSVIGLSRDELRQSMPVKLDKNAFDVVLAQAIERGLAMHHEGFVSHPKAGAGAKDLEEKTGNKILAILEQAGTTPPSLSVLLQECNAEESVARKALTSLTSKSILVRVNADIYYAASVIEQHKQQVQEHIEAAGPSTAADLKTAMGISRKYAMPLLEYFDSIGFTRRNGDFRTLV